MFNQCVLSFVLRVDIVKSPQMAKCAFPIQLTATSLAVREKSVLLITMVNPNVFPRTIKCAISAVPSMSVVSSQQLAPSVFEATAKAKAKDQESTLH